VNFDPVTLLPRLFAVAMILLISFPVHEFAHALAAYRLGDGTAKLFGRLTLNPIAHFDPLGGLLLLVSSLSGFGIGWAKPTPVNPANLRGGRDSEGIVAFAGPASDNGMAVPPVILNALAFFILINVALMIFNLVPIPPLDGSKVLFSMLSPRQVWQWRPVLEQYGFLILILVAFVPILPGGETVFVFIFSKIGIPIVNILVGRPIFG